MILIRGIKAWLVLLAFIIVAVIALVIFFQLAIIILPIALVLGLLGYLWKRVTKVKKKNYVDVKYKVK